jgi:hypothetical protein
MLAKYGATFAELALLRALYACGGRATFAQLSRGDIKGLERVIGGMLSHLSKPKSMPLKKSLRPGGQPRGPLLRKRVVNGQVIYEMTILARTAAVFPGPWKREHEGWCTTWTPWEVSVTGHDGTPVGRFTRSTMAVADGRPPVRQPGIEAWRQFRDVMRDHFRVRVPQEAIPDFVRFPPEMVLPQPKKMDRKQLPAAQV